MFAGRSRSAASSLKSKRELKYSQAIWTIRAALTRKQYILPSFLLSSLSRKKQGYKNNFMKHSLKENHIIFIQLINLKHLYTRTFEKVENYCPAYSSKPGSELFVKVLNISIWRSQDQERGYWNFFCYLHLFQYNLNGEQFLTLLLSTLNLLYEILDHYLRSTNQPYVMIAWKKHLGLKKKPIPGATVSYEG